MGALENVKDLVKVIKGLGNAELHVKIMELESGIRTLVDENRELKERLDVQEDLVPKGNAYWRKSGDGPFCVPCWDGKSKLMRLSDDEGH